MQLTLMSNEKLISHYLERIDKNDDDVEALFELGKISLDMGLLGEAKRFIANVMALEPWHTEAKKILKKINGSTRHVEIDGVVEMLGRTFSNPLYASCSLPLDHSNKKTDSTFVSSNLSHILNSLPSDGCHRPLNILYISLEFSTWLGARSLSYSAQLGLEEGFDANNIDYLTIPAIQGIPWHFPASWLSRAKRICAGKHFDQVWVELVHTELDPEFLEWLASLAPVRVGLILESLKFDEEMYDLHPPLRNRMTVVYTRLRYMTHALAVDEVDADTINNAGQTKALWWPQAVPERWIRARPETASTDCALFGGAAYTWRQRIMNHPSLVALLTKMPSPENATMYPALFDAVNRHCMAALNTNRPVDDTMLADYLSVLRGIRQECFSLWLKNLGTGCAIVNLPGYIKAYPGRVVEGMAAGRPIISAEVPERPRTKALFQDGADMLLFPHTHPEMLEKHIIELRNNPERALQLADNARSKLWRFHTMEKRIAQVQCWIQTGIEPCYHEEVPNGRLYDSVQKFCDAFAVAVPIEVSQAVSADTDLQEYARLVGSVLEQRNIEKAIVMLERAVHLEPHFSEMLMSLCSTINNIDQAALYSLVAIANNKPDVELLLAACVIAERQKNHAAGNAFMKEALRRNPSEGQYEKLLQFDFREEPTV